MACREGLLRAVARTSQHRQSGRRRVQAVPGRTRAAQGGGVDEQFRERIAFFSPPPCGEGAGGGGRERYLACGYPLPNPPPQGGRSEQRARTVTLIGESKRIFPQSRNIRR